MGDYARPMTRFLKHMLAGGLALLGTAGLAQEPVGQISLGFGIDEKREAVAQLSVATRRAFDRDVFAQLELEASQSTRSAMAGLMVPGLFGESPAVGIDLGYQTTEGRGTFAFDQTRAKAELVAVWPETTLGQIEAFYAVRQARISDVSAAGSALLQADLGTRTHHVLGYRWAKGFGDVSGTGAAGRISLTQEVSRSSDSRTLLRSELGLGARSARMGAAQLSFGLRAGAVAATGGATRVEDRFFLGPNDIRGFALAGIGPRDRAAGDAALGGNLFTTARLDLKFPEVIQSAPSLTPGLFVDAGALWSLDSVAGGPAGASPVDDSALWRASAGVSIAWDLGPGDLRLDLSRALKAQSYDVVQNVQLAFQTSF